ncbi:MAG: hypothetical protein L6V93_19625 [Clostridiales bacterium]|nr:MAG: hypothetical protein L6V93_19625 [Clostridiales bacterium]
MVSMALLTFIFFVYTRLFGQMGAILPLYNTLLILSFASFACAAVFAVIAIKKSEFFVEYSLFVLGFDGLLFLQCAEYRLSLQNTRQSLQSR